MYRVITDLGEVCQHLSGSTIIGLDIEASPDEAYRGEEKAALDPHKSTITGISISISEGSAIYIPLRHRIGVNTNPDEVLRWLAANVLQNPDVTLVCHNLAFESAFFYALGIVPTCKVYDTMIAAQMTLKGNTSFRKLADSGLKTLVQELLDVELPTFEEVTDGRHFDDLDYADSKTILYACSDADYTLRLYHLFNAWFDKYLPKHRYIVENIESPAAVFMGLMRYNGILVDTALMANQAAECEERMRRLRADIAFIIGDVNIGVNAST